MPHEIASLLTCKLCPPAMAKKIAGPALVLGAGQSNRVGHFMQAMAEHIKNDHPNEHRYLEQKMLEFMGLQTVLQYTTNDENIRHSRNWLRWQIHQATLNARIPDGKLEERSKEFALRIVEMVAKDLAAYFMAAERPPQWDHLPTLARVSEKVIELTRGIRDELQEPTEPTLTKR